MLKSVGWGYPMRELLRILVLVVALTALVIGAVLGLLTVALSLGDSGPDTLSIITLGGSLSILSLSLGSASAWHAWQAVRGNPSTAFRPKRIWLLAVLYVMALALGQALLSLSLLPIFAFPFLHVAATTIPALIIVALIGRALRGVSTWRDLVLQVTGGALLATPLAFIVEATAVLLIVTAAIIGLAYQPGGLDLLERIATQLQDSAWLQDPGALGSVVLTPAVMVTALAIIAGIVPMIEETVKTVGVAIAGYRRPSLPQAVFWGIAAGAGFAIAEGLLNATVDLAGWLVVVVLRVGTTLLHCTTGAVMGLAWYQGLALSRRSRAVALYLASVAVHGLWNALTLGVTVLALKSLDGGALSTGQATMGLGVLAILALLGALALGMVGGLVGLTVYARRQVSPQADTSQPMTFGRQEPPPEDVGQED